MSERNVETVRRAYAQKFPTDLVGDPAGLASVAELFDPEVEVRQMAGMTGTAGTFVGYAGLAESFAEIFRELKDVQFVLEHISPRGDAVATAFLFRAQGRTSGVPVEFRGSHEFHLRDGRIVRVVVHEDPEAAFRAIGAEPPEASD